MNMTKGLALTMGAVAIGFLVGFAIGGKTKDAAPSRVKTDMSGGVVTVEIDMGNAVMDGIGGIIDEYF